eukprot:CAMPEP_0204309478 /NCGR_PEP_ID=MMETSP0469-20131031/1122_1 /ASSEMBLY_ACC=CAM_ASM_000384 /TAXON_ID=2969 /ORGANISM="Oxyrrhis marina" /LENGTH=431 /DNA_ID=CAMNT_0051289107 /DNA_START=297 /DNA_END=1590 /DNA_ORIENTATION=+
MRLGEVLPSSGRAVPASWNAQRDIPTVAREPTTAYLKRDLDDTRAFSLVSMASAASAMLAAGWSGITYSVGVPWLLPWTVPFASTALLFATSAIAVALFMEDTCDINIDSGGAACGDRVVMKGSLLKGTSGSGASPCDTSAVADGQDSAAVTKAMAAEQSLSNGLPRNQDTTVGATASENLQPTSASCRGAVGVDYFSMMMVVMVAASHFGLYSAWDSAYPAYASLPKAGGGQGWSAAEVGFSFIFATLAWILFALLVYPNMVHAFGLVQCWLMCWFPCLILMPAFPRAVAALLDAGWDPHSWPVVVVNYIAQSGFSFLMGNGLISGTLMVFDFVAGQPESDKLLAEANGYLSVAQGLGGGLGPTVAGWWMSLGLAAEVGGSKLVGRAVAFDGLAVAGLLLCVAPIMLLPEGAIPDRRSAAALGLRQRTQG